MSHHRNLIHFTCTISGNRRAIGNLSEVVIITLEKMEIPVNPGQLGLVLSEALTNALLYGSYDIPADLRDSKGEEAFWRLVDQREQDSAYAKKTIVLQIDCFEDMLDFEIMDQGEGFDWREFMTAMPSGDRELLQGSGEMKTHGRGLAIIRNHVERLSWNDKGNSIRFSIKPPTA